MRDFFARKRLVPVGGLRKWNIILAALYVLQGIAILLMSVPHEVPLNVSFLTTDSLQSKLTGGTVIAPAAQQLAVLNLTYLVAASLFVAAVIRLLAATVYRTRYELGLRERRDMFRPAQYAVAGALILMAIGLLAGAYDIGSLLLIVTLSLVAGGALFALGAARNHGDATNGIAILAAGMPWVIIGLHVAATAIFGFAGANTWLYWLLGTGVCAWILVGLNTWLGRVRLGAWGSYVYAEGWHMALSFVALTGLAWEMFAGVLHP